MFKIIEWAWGHKLGKLVKYKSFRPGLELTHLPDWQEWGVGWPTMLIDDHSGRRTSTPIWNFVWLRNRLGFKSKDPGYPSPM